MTYIDVKGIIDNDQVRAMMEFWGGGQEIFSVETVNRFLADNPNETEITLNIDCDGGSVEEGLKIYDALRMSGKIIFTNITGGCHSMAIVVLLAAPPENRSANKNVRALIHRVYAGVCDYVSAEDCLDMAEDLIREEEAILDIYVERTGAERDMLAEVMREERVHDAKSLLELGFISKINAYNTNQFFNSFKIMTQKKESAFDRFMSKVNAYKAKRNESVVNFDFKDADGEVVFSTETEEDALAVGDTVTLASGETSGTFTLDDGREVIIEDNVVTEIKEEESESLESRVAELEGMLEEATNLVQEQERELNNYRGSDYQPKNRKTTIPPVKGKNSAEDKRTTEDVKALARERMDKVNARKVLPSKK